MPPDPARPLPDASELFARFLEAWHEGHGSLDALCGAHPEHAATFRAWWDNLRRIGEVADEASTLDSERPHPSASPPEPSTFGHYEILREIGRGGQGVVYLARDESLQRLVALKMLQGFDVSAPERLARFRREAKLAARLTHPGICAVYSTGVEEAVPYIAMQYVPGQDLAEHIANAKTSSDSASTTIFESGALVRQFEKLARALHVAHEAGLVHRDIKPRNVMIDEAGEPVLLDFGLARDLDEEATGWTGTGDVFGTPAYMAPEQIDFHRGPVDRRTDVFALGATLFHALTLHRPFEAPTREGLFQLILKGPPPDPRRHVPGMARDLATVVQTALSREADQRYATAEDFAEDLRRVAANEPIRARPAGPWLRLRRWSARNPALATALFAVFTFLVAGLVLTNIILADVRRLFGELGERNQDYRRMADTKRLESLLGEARELKPLASGATTVIGAWLREAHALEARAPRHRETLERLRRLARGDDEAAEQTTWRFAEAEQQWEHDVVATLVSELERHTAEGGLFRRVEAWEEFAHTVRQRSLEAPAEAWRAAIAAIADSAASPWYGGLALEPQVGLVPLGPDPDTGLQEFAHLLSGEVPGRRRDGRLVLEEESAIVLVLLPGATFRMGADRPEEGGEKSGPNIDRWCDARTESPAHDVTVGPFFISKYEMTQGQWLRFTGSNPAAYRPEFDLPGGRTSLLHPVENLSWTTCTRVLAQLGLALPSEAQWEYAARSGTRSVWFSGDDRSSVEGCANLADKTVREYTIQGFPRIENWRDGAVLTAPVGRYEPNDFGLHDVIGNVREWTRTPFLTYKRTVSQEKIDKLNAPPFRVYRGGSFKDPAVWARSAVRPGLRTEQKMDSLGLRPVRPLE